MNEWVVVGLLCIAFFEGIFVGYIKWAPMTPFKEGVMEGITFGLWKRKK
jgi:hypothetical protein